MDVLSRLKSMSDLEIQGWLRKVGQENVPALTTALLGADGEVKARVYRNMSERARAALQAGLEEAGRRNVPQESILASARQLEKLI